MKKIVDKIFASKLWWLPLLVVLFGINYLASVFHARLDLTKEKRYTLSKATKDLLKNLDEDVQIDVFLKGEFPAKFRKLTNSVSEFLQLLKESNSSKVNHTFISPLDEIPGTNGRQYADTLESMGAYSLNLKAQVKTGESSSLAYPFAIIKYKGKQELVTLFTVPSISSSNNEIPEKVINSAEALLEYQFASAIDKLNQNRKPGIAYSIGNGEPVDGRTYDLVRTLRQDYEFRTLDIKLQPRIPAGVDVLVVVKPSKQFTEDEKLKIDQFVMNGGKLLFFIDNLIAEQDSLALKPETIAYDRDLNLTDLLFRYGIRINTDLVMDLRCDLIPIVVGGNVDNPQIQFLPWNYYPRLTAEGGMNNNVNYIGSRFANSIDTIQVKGVRRQPLLVSSPNSRIISTPALISLNENKTVPEDDKFKRNAIPVGMLLEGKFTSLYSNRITKSQIDTFTSMGMSFKEISPENKMMIIADGDIVLNDFIPNPQPNSQPLPLEMGWNKYTFREYQEQTEFGKLFIPVANKQFLLNSMEYLVKNPAISETRNKDIVLRLLDTEKIEKQKTTWQLINIALPILLVILFGFVYQQIRKRKYAA
jgi:ABC-2 type transport system permease protein